MSVFSVGSFYINKMQNFTRTSLVSLTDCSIEAQEPRGPITANECSVYIQSTFLTAFRLCSLFLSDVLSIFGPCLVRVPSTFGLWFCLHSVYVQSLFWLCSDVTFCVPSIVLSVFCLGSVYVTDLFHQICSLSMSVWLW